MIFGHQIFSACIQLGAHAGKLIRAVQASGSLETVDKGNDDPCTLADRNSEDLIVSTLARYFPAVTVIGEENIQPNPDNVAEISTEVVSQELVPEQYRELDPARVTVWVDPLDGTKNFTLGDLVGVTTLIGIAYDTQPIFGVIHHVFAAEHPIYWGGPGLGVYRTLDPAHLGDKLHPDPAADFSVASTRLHTTPTIDPFLAQLAPDRSVKADGSGYKALLVLTGEVALYIFDAPYTKRWDTCASEALVRALDGEIVGLDGAVYDYSRGVSPPNANGIVISRDHSKTLRVVNTWQAFNN